MGANSSRAERCRLKAEECLLMAERARDPKAKADLLDLARPRRPSMRRRNAAMAERRTQPLQIFLAADQLAAVEEFRYQARMPSRSAAVRELLRRGLARASRASGARPNAPFAPLEMLTAERS